MTSQINKSMYKWDSIYQSLSVSQFLLPVKSICKSKYAGQSMQVHLLTEKKMKLGKGVFSPPFCEAYNKTFHLVKTLYLKDCKKVTV